MANLCNCKTRKSPIVEKAIRFAMQKHDGQVDDNGEWFFWAHCRHVGMILHSAGYDDDIVAAGYLHDTIEDTNTTYTELVKEFGERIAGLVYEVTHEGTKEQGYYFPRLKSQDAILIKLADRMSNVGRMNAWPKSRREHYLRSTQFWRTEPV